MRTVRADAFVSPRTTPHGEPYQQHDSVLRLVPIHQFVEDRSTRVRRQWWMTAIDSWRDRPHRSDSNLCRSCKSFAVRVQGNGRTTSQDTARIFSWLSPGSDDGDNGGPCRKPPGPDIAAGYSLRLEQEDCTMSQVEIDEVFCFYY